MGWHEEEPGTRCGDPGREGRDGPLCRVVVPRQKVVVRVNGLRTDDAEGGYLPVVRPYGLLRMAWAIWREIPGLEPREALSLARKVRWDGEAEVLVATRFLTEHVGGMLLARHRLVARLERAY